MDVAKYLEPYRDVWLSIPENDEGTKAKELLLNTMKGYLHRVVYVGELGIQCAIDEIENLQEEIDNVIQSWQNGKDLIEELSTKKSPYASYNKQFQI